jgi:hypothetical protein
MALETINMGNKVNDGLGDDLRTAFTKVNANFAALTISLTVTASNTAGGGAGVFKEKVGTDLIFKRLAAGNNISLDTTTDAVIINSTIDKSFNQIYTQSGSILADTHPKITFQGIEAPNSTSGNKDIEVTASGAFINFKTLIPVTDILTTYDFGNITGSNINAMQLLYSATSVDFGTIASPTSLNLDCGTLT